MEVVAPEGDATKAAEAAEVVAETVATEAVTAEDALIRTKTKEGIAKAINLEVKIEVTEAAALPKL